MKICSRKKIVIALAFFCVSFYMPFALAVTFQPGSRQRPVSEVTAPPHPTIQVREPDYHFGEVQEGAEIEHEFTVRNTGNAVLNIERVRVD